MKYLTTAEVAEILQCHTSTVSRMACEGKFPGAVIIGTGQRRSWRFPPDAVHSLPTRANSDLIPMTERKADPRGFEILDRFKRKRSAK